MAERRYATPEERKRGVGGWCIACGALLDLWHFVCPDECLPTRAKPKGTK